MGEVMEGEDVSNERRLLTERRDCFSKKIKTNIARLESVAAGSNPGPRGRKPTRSRGATEALKSGLNNNGALQPVLIDSTSQSQCEQQYSVKWSACVTELSRLVEGLS